jgi:ribosome biogenesis GTPase A
MTAELTREVQWYPGHMAKAMRRIGEYFKLVDVVVEVADARVARSGRNPALDAMAGKRSRILVLTREDLADPSTTKAWLRAFADGGLEAVAVDGRSQRGVARIAGAIARTAPRKGTSRAIVVGIPNSGKSSIVNALIRRAAAKTENRAGVTRQLQWFRMAPGIELMDTPGVLVPKISGKDAQWMLAICGALPRERYDAEEIANAFHRWLVRRRPRTRVPNLDAFARARGFMRRGGEIDWHNAALSYLRAFNDGSFGRISFETPENADDSEAA